MFKFKKLQLRSGLIAAVLLGGLFLLNGCGDFGRSPLVSTPGQSTPSVQKASEQAKWNPNNGYLVFSKRAATRAMKPAILDSESGLYHLEEAKEFTPADGGSMEIDFEQPAGGPEDVQVRYVTFTVPANSIGTLPPNVENGNYLITLNANSGTSLDDVLMQFGPSGLTFVPHAVLDIKLVGNVDISGMGTEAYHVEGDGTVTVVPMTVTATEDGCEISIEVPGFSSYSMGGEDE